MARDIDWVIELLRGLSTSARLMVLTFLITLGAILALGTSVYVAVSNQLDRDTREYVRAEASDLLGLYNKTDGDAALIEEVNSRTKDPANEDMLYSLRAYPSGALLAGTKSEMLAPGWHTFSVLRDGSPQRVIANVALLDDDLTLTTGMQTRAEDGFLAVMSRNALLALGVAALLSLIVGWLVSHWVANRLLKVDHVIERVAEGDLTARVLSDHTDDAFDRMGSRVNFMLDRFVESMDGVRNVTDHIAHDLRTPLTRLRNRLSDLRASAPSPLLDDAIEDTDQLLSTFGSMLRLSRIENSSLDEWAEMMSLDALLLDAIELYEPLATAKNITITPSLAPCNSRGDRDQMFQVCANLLDNAVKYSPTHSSISVSSFVEDDFGIIAIADQGPGIREEDHARVFDRFVRLESHRGTPGNGLGLSLVRAVVTRHNGTVTLSDHQPGLVVELKLPAG